MHTTLFRLLYVKAILKISFPHFLSHEILTKNNQVCSCNVTKCSKSPWVGHNVLAIGQQGTLTVICDNFLPIIILGGLVADQDKVSLMAVRTGQIVHQVGAVLQTSVTLKQHNSSVRHHVKFNFWDTSAALTYPVRVFFMHTTTAHVDLNFHEIRQNKKRVLQQ